MTDLTVPSPWTGTSGDPNDEQFGDVVETATLATAGKYDAVLVGEPYDGAVIGRPGARAGPAALRRELSGTKTHHIERGPIHTVADLGDIEIPAGGVERVQSAVRSVTTRVHATSAVPVFLGGDNSLTFPNAAPLVSDDTVGVVSFDAHLDCRAVQDEPTSGTPYRQLHDAGLDTLAVVGARHFETSTAYHDYLAEQGGTVLSPESVTSDPLGAVDDALAALGDVDAVYASLDLDVLDATAAPGVSAPTPGGLSTRELFRMLGRVASDDRIAGFEVVECAPPLDTGNRTARAGARAIAHFLSGLGGDR
ncbi:formimidoylglutamase [Haloarcula japonica]|uniref:Formimidoylglutamase n=1 Tax=Haloarcula japonica (strain ATCC 49778 / DSM 6131 / JCM 7785 / NBRC 101032 / NCIMB 13157 / TR-1) TaxID=1227453 RepID=M0LHN2_HALJT|nr:formimidoylglutamase [Haloarcula japonica]EMA33137.1 formimidoylglutamase [Haloarcula japonica DSM 6131]